MATCLLIIFMLAISETIYGMHGGPPPQRLPEATDRQLGGYYNGTIVLIGGNNGTNGPTNRVWSFDNLDKRLKLNESGALWLPVFTGSQSFTTNGDVIYFMSDGIDALYSYNISNNSISLISVLTNNTQQRYPYGGGCVTMNIRDNIIYVIGGVINIVSDDYDVIGYVQEYNLSSQSWINTKPDTMEPRVGLTCEYFNYTDHLYVIGGRSVAGFGAMYEDYLDTIEWFDQNNNRWEYFYDDLFIGLSQLRSVIHHELQKIIVIGGLNDGITFNITHILDPFTETVSLGPDLRNGICNHVAIYDPVSTTIFIFGGYQRYEFPNGGEYVDTIEKLTIQNTTINPVINHTSTLSIIPTQSPTITPNINPTFSPSIVPTKSPNINPTLTPSGFPTFTPTINLTLFPSNFPTINPSSIPTLSPNTPSINITLNPRMPPLITIKSEQNGNSPNITLIIIIIIVLSSPGVIFVVILLVGLDILDVI